MKKVKGKIETKKDSGIVPQKSTSNADENLKRLVCSGILKEFVRDNSGAWDHQGWLDLCDKISKEGYAPIDFDQVGLALENERTDYSNKLII